MATAIRDQTDGRLKQDCEVLIGYATRYLASGELVAPISRYRMGIPVSTTNDVPGYEIIEYIGEVFGLVVRSRGAIPQLGAGLKSIVGGEIGTMTNLLRDTRSTAIDRMVAEAVDREADAVIAMRFDVQAMEGSWTEVCAYGTAVRLTKRSAN